MSEQPQAQPQPTRGQILEQESAEERVAFAAYKETFLLQNPLPPKPAALDLRGLGFAFWLYFTQAITSIALAAMRTSDAFYFVGYATVGSQFYASAEAVLSVLAVEVGMVVFAAILAQKRHKKQEAELRAKAEAEGVKFRSSKEVDMNAAVIWAGLILMALISMAAGLHQSVKIIEGVSEDFLKFLSYGLGVTIGVGITVIAVIAGDILGQQLAIITAGYADRVADYEDKLDEWNDAVKAAWARSDQRKIILAEVRAAAKNSSISEFHYGTRGTLNGTPSQGVGFGNGRRPPVQTERVFQYMDQILQTENRIPTFGEVQQVLGIPKSSASRIRKEWLVERGISEVAGENGHTVEEGGE